VADVRTGVTLTADTFARAADLLYPEPDRYLSDPVGWVQDKLGEFLWSKQREIAQALVEHRYVAVQSAHDTGKSHGALRIASWWLNTRPDPFATTTAPTTKTGPRDSVALHRSGAPKRKAAWTDHTR
jgi:hypothetical protein